VFNLAVVPAATAGLGQFLVCDRQGGLVPLDHQGREGKPVLIGNHFIRYLAAADLDGDGEAEMCGLATLRPGQDTAIGISPEGTELWAQELPVGRNPWPSLEPIAAGALFGERPGQWVLAGADGSLLIVAADGALVDHFAYGAALTGFGICQLEGQPALLVASAGGVEAMRLIPR